MKKRKPDAPTAVVALLFSCTVLLLCGLVLEERAELHIPAEYVYWEEPSSQAKDASQAVGASAWEASQRPDISADTAESQPSLPPEPDNPPAETVTPRSEGGASLPSSASAPPLSGRIKIYLEDPAAPEEESRPEEASAESETSEALLEESSRETFDPNGIVNLNTAGIEELKSLKGIGEVLARRIIDYREQLGGFDSIEEIMEVKGIAEGKFADIRDRITV